MERNILALLDEFDGNVQAVSERLSISESYIQRIKRDKWQAKVPPTKEIVIEQAESPPARALTAPTIPAENPLLAAMIPPDVGAVVKLRTHTIGLLEERIARGDIADKHLVSLLRGLLSFEAETRAAVRPLVAVYEDNRTINLNTLVEKLKGYTPEQLRLLAQVETAEVIDV